MGHAVLCGKEAVGEEPFAVILPDDLVIHTQPALVQMMGAWRANPGNYIAVEEVPPERVSSYGIVTPAPDGVVDSRTTRLLGMVEKPPVDQAPSNLGIVGRYILMPEVLRAIESTEPGAIGEIQLTDGIAATMDSIRYLCVPVSKALATTAAIPWAFLGLLWPYQAYTVESVTGWDYSCADASIGTARLRTALSNLALLRFSRAWVSAVSAEIADLVDGSDVPL